MNSSRTMGQTNVTRQLTIIGMDCGSCALTIENSVRQLPGVDDVSVSFTTERMALVGNVKTSAVASRLADLGYRLAEDTDTPSAKLLNEKGLAGFIRFMLEQPSLRTALFVALMMIAGITVTPALGIDSVANISLLSTLFGAGVLIAGAPVFIKGFRALVFARRITIDLLMALAALGAISIGETGEAVTVILLFMLGEALEAYSAERARDSLRSLMALQPQEATVLEAHAGDHKHSHDHQVIKAIADIKIGERVLVRPGQRIPVDGQIIKGISSVNQAPVTGEDMPVIKNLGDEVMAGTVNGEAALEVRVMRPSSEGTIARIAKLVEQAQAERSPAERFIDRFARYYTPAVVVLALLIVTIPVLAFGAPFLDGAEGTRGWLYRGLTMLIIACPCALVISIPVTVVSGLTRLAQLGVLVKSGALLDRIADLEVIAFDKTGTLTKGQPTVVGIQTKNCSHEPARYKDCSLCAEVIENAAAVEMVSEHPVAKAIISAANSQGKTGTVAHDVAAHPGTGVSGTAECGHTIRVGNRKLFAANQADLANLENLAHEAESAGQTVMYVSHNDAVIGYIAVQDAIRIDSAPALAELSSMTPPLAKVMLTGDNQRAAQRVAETVPGIDEVHAGLLPDQKLLAIEKLGENGAAVAMVGDGINDAPALARADIGIAMGGGGTAQAMETADVVLLQDDLSHVPLAVRMARNARRIIKQNIYLSLGLKLAFLGLAVPGIATLWMAVLADVGATLLVTLNGMRLLRQN